MEVKTMPRNTLPFGTSNPLAAAAFLAALALLAGGCSKQESASPEPMQTMQAPPEVSEDVEAIIEEPAIEVVATPAEMAEPAMEAGTDAPATASGEEIYTKTCANCHNAGIAGAPKLGDKEGWAPRIAKGNDAMFESVKNGLNVMPPKGTCMNCSDEELRSAMEYMVSQGS
jgi:cytochrome c5